MEQEQFKTKYNELNRFITTLLHPLVFAYENYDVSSKIEEDIKNTVRNKELQNKIFITFLEMIDIKNIKHVNMKNLSYKEILNTNIHQIINCICNEKIGVDKIEYFKYHIMSYYIVFSHFCELTNKQNYWNSTQLYFFKEIYFNLEVLQTSFLEYRKKQFPDEDYSDLPACYSYGYRHDLDIFLGIRHLLYSGTVFDAGSQDQPNMSIFIMRGYIENWLRKNFAAYSGRSNFLPISQVFDVLKYHKDEIKNDKIASEVKYIDKHIESLSIINNWSNLYVHSEKRPIFWVPYIILIYLTSLISECRDAYIRTSNIHSTNPPFIPEKSDVYSLICNDISSLIKKDDGNSSI